MNVRHVMDDQREGRAAVALEVLRTIARRPSAWLPAMTCAVRFAPQGWWRRPPFLPLPDERYWRFRMETAFGDEDAVPDAGDLLAAMRWTRRATGRQR